MELSLRLKYGLSSCAADNGWGVCAENAVYICTFLHFVKSVLKEHIGPKCMDFQDVLY
jgi:hypothetical protein